MPPVRLLAALALFVVGSARAADNAPATNSLFVTALAGAQDFAATRGAIEDASNGTVALGFRFTDRVSLELAGGRTDTVAGAGNDVKVDSRRLDALWHFAPANGWHPYAAAGIGEQSFDSAAALARETVIGAGGGFFRHLAGPLKFRADVRLLYSVDESESDVVAGAGLVLGFGGPVDDLVTPDGEENGP